ncbi:transcription termination factor MTERF15, mitochondrial [Lycium ferocissimum]|uniref:transcription termination factor MTERF15, mitochondrial n=1 Tax=Lycium ferocissimum TaxID=112874 RepID=UPI0028160591|nr:transcription termination factor MTERF15, mitochondrial [Lycium ferocissimum]
MNIRILKSLFTSFSSPTTIIPNPNLRYFCTNTTAVKRISQFKYPLQFQQKSPQRNLIAVSSLLTKYGFPALELPDFLERNRRLLNLDPAKIEKSLKVLLSLKPSQEFLVSMISSCPRVLEYDAIKKWEGGIQGLEEGSKSYLSSLAIRNILEVSVKFELDYDCVLGSLKCLKDLGITNITLNKVLETCPMVTTMSAIKIHDTFEFVINAFGIGRVEFDSILNVYPGILTFGFQSKVKQLLDEFKVLGFNTEMVKKQVLKDPGILALEVGELSRCLELLKSLKCREIIKKDIFREGFFKAGYEVKLRVDCLRNHGLTLRDAYSVLWKEPRVILYHIEDVERKIQFLVNVMKVDIHCLIEVPEYLGVNFEKHILPRFKVIDYLRSIGGLGDEVGLRELIKPSRLKFYNLYVKPYPECEAIYGRFARNDEVRSRHPVGMWKLFKPQNNPKSTEDIMNIKSYMDSLA